MSDMTKEIIIGTAAAVFSALIICSFSPIPSYIKDYFESVKIYNWLKNNSSKELGNTFRSTRAIPSHCNLT